MTHPVNDLLERYRDTRREVMSLINRLRTALAGEYIMLGMEPPEALTSVHISPIDARVEALDLGYVIMENLDRYYVNDLMNPQRAAERLRAKLVADIEKHYNILQDRA